MPNSSIWVLVANEQEAAICTSRYGSSELLQSMNGSGLRGDARDASTKDSDGSLRGREFAGQLMLTLFRGALTQACDGIVIVASASMMGQLRRIKPDAVGRLLIAEIIDETGQQLSLTGHPDWPASLSAQQPA